jgi:hypothetical protein
MKQAKAFERERKRNSQFASMDDKSSDAKSEISITDEQIINTVVTVTTQNQKAIAERLALIKEDEKRFFVDLDQMVDKHLPKESIAVYKKHKDEFHFGEAAFEDETLPP